MELRRRVRFEHEDLGAVRMTIGAERDALTVGDRIEGRTRCAAGSGKVGTKNASAALGAV